MNYRTILLVIASVVLLVVVTFIMYKQSVDNVAQPLAEQTAEPQKTEFGSEIPNNFPTDIPIEKGVKVEQSYGLNYTNQEQLTIVFPSTKTVKENYALYASFLEKQQWNISNKYESAKISSLYGTKENNDMNITISENTATGLRPGRESVDSNSQVSISVLNK